MFLDIFRGIAALSVLLFHYSRDLVPIAFLPPINYGYMGVHLFFIISGFVIYMTLEHTKTTDQFIISRFSRLFPGFWMNVTLTFVLLEISEVVPRFTIKEYLINLTMLQHWFIVKPLDGVFWTLAVELSFYIVMLILFITKQIKNIYFWGIAFMMTMIIVNEANKVYDLPLYYILPLLHWGNLFFAGIIFYKIYSSRVGFKEIFLLLAVIICQFVINKNLTENYIIILLLLLFYIAIKLKYDWYRLKVLIFIGSISYSLYLIHEVNGLILYQFTEFIHLKYLRVLLVVLFMIFGSYLITYYIEKPAKLLIRKVHKILSSKSYGNLISVKKN